MADISFRLPIGLLAAAIADLPHTTQSVAATHTASTPEGRQSRALCVAKKPWHLRSVDHAGSINEINSLF